MKRITKLSVKKMYKILKQI